MTPASPQPFPSPAPSVRDLANAIRFLSADAVDRANSGHPGMPMGMADVATVLFRNHLKFDPKEPLWPDRDRFILSGGHGSMLLYALAYLTGYERMTIEEIKNFRQLHSLTPGHPEKMPETGIEMTTGPLGQGIASAVGFALAERIKAARFGDSLVNHFTYVFCGDGDLMEGISHEACSLAGHLKLSKLVVLYDDNQISIDGPTSLSFTDDTLKRFESYGWRTDKIDGHNPDDIDAALTRARAGGDRPSLIACRTKIGFGAPNKEGTSGVHGSPLGAEETAAARKNLGWTAEPFTVPTEILHEWRNTGTRGQVERLAWTKRLAASSQRTEFEKAQNPDVMAAAKPALAAVRGAFLKERPKMATRAASGKVLEALVPLLPQMIGGSADLTPSNNTRIKGAVTIAPDKGYAGQYIHYGVREFAMAAIMNGLALSGGIIPYGGTFLSFADYARPAIRLAALMKLRVVYVMTHDSIGLGEDGPTHQPVEHLAALRAIPNVKVYRPCDGAETAECWEMALQDTSGPSVLALSRQNLPTLCEGEGRAACGAYVLIPESGALDAVLLATGSEVEIAVRAREILKDKGISARVVSVPCFEIFREQSEAYQEEVLGPSGPVRVGIEAGIRQGWDELIGPGGVFIGMNGFGESAPAEVLYKHFGITPESVAGAAERAWRAKGA